MSGFDSTSFVRFDILDALYRARGARLQCWDTKVGGTLADALTCNAVVKSFGAEPREDARWRTPSAGGASASSGPGALQLHLQHSSLHLDQVRGRNPRKGRQSETSVRVTTLADGGDPLPSTPQEYAADIAKEEPKWSALIRKLGLGVE